MENINSKYPQLLIFGEPVKENQAKEIILRTDSSIKDLVRQNIHCSSFVQEKFKHFYNKNFLFGDGIKYLEKIGYIDNLYITNEWIHCHLSSPKGWMHLDGNIGHIDGPGYKWPEASELVDEFSSIGKEFSFLKLFMIVSDTDRENTNPIFALYLNKGKIEEVSIQFAIDAQKDYPKATRSPYNYSDYFCNDYFEALSWAMKFYEKFHFKKDANCKFHDEKNFTDCCMKIIKQYNNAMPWCCAATPWEWLKDLENL